MIKDCNMKSLLSHLTSTSNLAETPTCMGYLWYLALDMQLHVLSPFLLLILNKQAKFGVLICLFLVGSSSFFRFLYCQFYKVCDKSDVDIPVSFFLLKKINYYKIFYKIALFFILVYFIYGQ